MRYCILLKNAKKICLLSLDSLLVFNFWFIELFPIQTFDHFLIQKMSQISVNNIFMGPVSGQWLNHWHFWVHLNTCHKNLTQRCCGTALMDGMIRKQVNQQTFFYLRMLPNIEPKNEGRFLPKNKFEAACRHVGSNFTLGKKPGTIKQQKHNEVRSLM